MAGIGFSLRRLTRQDNLAGVLQAYGHGAFASTGPWLATVLALGAISIFGQQLSDFDTLQSFRLIIIYNFALSLVSTGPVMLVATRQIADLVYLKRMEECSALFLSAVGLLIVVNVPLALGLYVGLASFDPLTTALACINFFLISAIWLASVFLSTLKAYIRVTVAFLSGMAIGTALALLLVVSFGTPGLLGGFSVGATILLFFLIGDIFAEYPPGRGSPLLIIEAFRNHPLLALSGFVYNFALWSDKFVMWLFAPERSIHVSGLVSYPDYDSAMFIAYLTIVPGLSLFLVIVETSFFEYYHRFYRQMLNHSTYAVIRRNQSELITTLNGGVRNMLVLQGTLTVLLLFGSAKLFDVLALDFTQLSIFRFGAIGSFFQCMTMFLMVMLSYFDLQRTTLGLQVLFGIFNVVFTYISIEMGYRFYGYGYLGASLVMFLATYVVLALFMQRLPYNAFISQNSSVE